MFLDTTVYSATMPVFVLGDSLTSDMQGGINFGIDTCWYNPEENPPNPDIPVTYEIRDLAELLQILGL